MIFLDRTVCELFAGVGGFRCGLNHIISPDDYGKTEDWNTVWFNQWEPAEKATQYAHGCYINRFGVALDLNGKDTTNISIEDVDKTSIPDFNLLVGGFPCQDYSVASSLSTSKGIEGKKGVLWWSIRDVIEAKQPPFVLLENVDRLIKSPASQRGRDFGIILTCLRDQGYSVEWRIINAAEYGFQQRRRRIFIFAYKSNTEFYNHMDALFDGIDGIEAATGIINRDGYFADIFPIKDADSKKIHTVKLPGDIGSISDSFKFGFENAGVMHDGVIYTVKTMPDYHGDYITLGDIMENGNVDEKFFIPEDVLYYKDPDDNHCNEMDGRLPAEKRHTWQYLKGSKRFIRKSANGHEYVYSEGAIPLIDASNKPARTMLTSEGSFNRSTHIVVDKETKRIRLLTAAETERIQGFPTDHTKYCKKSDGKIVEMPLNKRRFMMGNALVVNLIEIMGDKLCRIFAEEL